MMKRYFPVDLSHGMIPCVAGNLYRMSVSRRRHRRTREDEEEVAVLDDDMPWLHELEYGRSSERRRAQALCACEGRGLERCTASGLDWLTRVILNFWYGNST